MLERMQDAPGGALALKASGTVMSRDIEAAVEAALGSTSATTGLVIVVDRDFDGYYAEISRGLADVSQAYKTVDRIAIVVERDQIAEAELTGTNVFAVPIRLFPASERAAAYGWAVGARSTE